MAEPSEASVKAPFDGSFDHDGVRSSFFRRDNAFFARTDGPDGRLKDFRIAYTFGLFPLQQYLIEQPGGRLQALGMAWDARPPEAGGQRWFHLYPGQDVTAGDPLHWTGIDQNWNFMCADCHSTNVRKGYGAATREFHTTYSEISVGCEACHGPGSSHVAWARDPGAWADRADRYLTAALDEREGVTWSVDSATGQPVRSEPRPADREIEVCARCHSRRSQLTDLVKAGDPFEDGFRASLLEPDLFFSDGQQLDEVYTYASFLQSKMYASGVTCSDCHEPHSGTLRFASEPTRASPSNALCTQCHTPATYESTRHHFHEAGAEAAACVTCHMPARTYMQIDARRDHSFRIPRPDRTATLGTPDVCTGACHQDRDASWAAGEIARRTGEPPGGFQRFAEAFHAADAGASGAAAALRGVLDDHEQPAIVRASALHRMSRDPSRLLVDAAAAALRDPDPMVRRAALEALQSADPATRLTLVPPLLTDPIRSVRIQAAVALADFPNSRLPEGFAPAFEEYLAEQQFNADRPGAQVNLGTMLAMRGQTSPAIAAMREAIRLDPTFLPAYINLSDIYRAQGNEASSEQALREALAVLPEAAEARHALGLALVRQRRTQEGLAELAAAARLAPGAARYAYVHGVALHDTGRPVEALDALRRVLAAHPNDRDVLLALAQYSDEQGRREDARRYAERLLALDPNDASSQALVNSLR
jgi:predicted CXXCH cytochrome family protein